MATADVDQKLLGRLARTSAFTNPILETGLYQLLGLSVRLSRQLLKARRLRRLDTTRDTKSLELYLHILWTSREGLTIVESTVLPHTNTNLINPEYKVITAKLIASFYHIICLFNNSPPVSQAKVPMYTSPGELRMAMAQSGAASSTRSVSRASEAGSTTPTRAVPPPLPSKGHVSSPTTQNGAVQGQRNNGGNGKAKSPPSRNPFFRDPVSSIQSDSSFVTNPYANMTPLKAPRHSPTAAAPPPPPPPPGLSNTGVPTLLVPSISPMPHPAGFLLPAQDYLPLTRAHFQAAQQAATLLPSNHPLRLSVALEHASFVWDCMHDHETSRRIARRGVRDILQSREGMSDADFQDAQTLVAALGAIMRRKSGDGHGTAKTTEAEGKAERRSSPGSGERKKKNGRK